MIIPVGFAQVNWRMGGPALPFGAECTQGLEIASFTPVTPDAVADALADAWSTNVMPQLSNSHVFVECVVKFGPNDTGPTGAVARSVQGSLAEQPGPPNVALLVRKGTATGGRRGRGRMYVPGVPEQHYDGAGDLATSSLGAYTVAFDGLYNDIVATGLLPVVLHAAGISTTPPPSGMTSYSPQRRMATQRDRMRR